MQQFTLFHQAQKTQEIKSLQKLLHEINSCLYHGEDMLLDQQKIQQCILLAENEHWANSYSDRLTWIKQEGTMHPDYLHLEDEAKLSTDIQCIWDKAGTLVEGEDILGILRDFYSELYQA